jgi:hypothetical protein
LQAEQQQARRAGCTAPAHHAGLARTRQIDQHQRGKNNFIKVPNRQKALHPKGA